MIVTPIKTRVFKEHESIVDFVHAYLPNVTEGSVVVITSKIVALAEGRTRENTAKNSLEKAVKDESESAFKTKYAWFTIKDGTVVANAGVDESNADGKLVLLPRDSFAAAQAIRADLRRIYNVKKLGVLITDSRLLPLRAGVVGLALGYAGFKGIREYRGKPDIFGRTMKLSRTDVADSLATAAVLEMGEGRERMPLAIIEGARIEFANTVDCSELKISVEDDIYRLMFTNKTK